MLAYWQFKKSQRTEKSKNVSLLQMVITPDRIPTFTIPCLQSGHAGRLETPRDREACAFGYPRRHTMPLLQRFSFCHPRTLNFHGHLPEDRFVDPTTRAAMSLPHLPKITTPYGFLTLGESPCVCRRESLFFDDHLSWSNTNGEHLAASMPIDSRFLPKTNLPLSDFGNIPGAKRLARSYSYDTATSNRCASRPMENCPSHSCFDSDRSTPVPSVMPSNGRLQRLLKKRLAAVKALTSGKRSQKR